MVDLIIHMDFSESSQRPLTSQLPWQLFPQRNRTDNYLQTGQWTLLKPSGEMSEAGEQHHKSSSLLP